MTHKANIVEARRKLEDEQRYVDLAVWTRSQKLIQDCLADERAAWQELVNATDAWHRERNTRAVRELQASISANPQERI